jgi:hypothetical protein
MLSDIVMLEVNLDALVDKSNSLLTRVNVGKALAEMAGQPMPHETGAMGNIMPKKKKGFKLVPKDIEDEKSSFVGGVEVSKTVALLFALQKLDSAAGIETQAGFGHEERVFDKEGRVIKGKKKVGEKDESLYVPEDIENEKGLVYKASYEQVVEGQSWTDKTSPADDSFYLPSKIRDENSDTDKGKEAKKKKKDADDAQRNYFGKVPDDASDQGKARPKQDWNTGGLEMASVGGVGINNSGLGKSKSSNETKRNKNVRNES